jgi:hypothetical protein
LDHTHYVLPETVCHLQEELLDGYTCPPKPPFTSPAKELTQSEFHSLRHYLSWVKSNGTVEAYYLHGRNLEDVLGEEILSLYSSQNLASTLTGLHPVQVDICPQSCIAYTGKFAGLSSCPFQ